MQGKTGHRAGTLTVLLLALLLPALHGVRPALAHAKVVGSTPADGSKLTAPPARVVVQFSEDLRVDASTMTISRLDGGRADAGDAAVARADRRSMSVGVASALPGVYTVHWHAVADEDNGITEGSITYTVVADVSAEATPSAAGGAAGAFTSGTLAQSPLPASGRPDMTGLLLLVLLMLSGLLLRWGGRRRSAAS
ncbi:MAG TPA: copper resistance CopC family protein [Chloroflexia bacterium]|nr:copper resistance CopC family protein [Chloroflexia bacterium]